MDMPVKEGAKIAITGLNGRDLNVKELVVNEAHPRPVSSINFRSAHWSLSRKPGHGRYL